MYIFDVGFEKSMDRSILLKNFVLIYNSFIGWK